MLPPAASYSSGFSSSPSSSSSAPSSSSPDNKADRYGAAVNNIVTTIDRKKTTTTTATTTATTTRDNTNAKTASTSSLRVPSPARPLHRLQNGGTLTENRNGGRPQRNNNNNNIGGLGNGALTTSRPTLNDDSPSTTSRGFVDFMTQQDQDLATHFRCCCCLHIRTVTLIVTSLLMIEIMAGLLFLFSSHPATEFVHSLGVLRTLRCLQLIPPIFAYVALLTRRHLLFLPIVVSQIALGSVADISSWASLVDWAQQSSDDESSHTTRLLTHSPWLFIVGFLAAYGACTVCVVYTYYRCSIYMRFSGPSSARVPVSSTSSALFTSLCSPSDHHHHHQNRTPRQVSRRRERTLSASVTQQESLV